MDFEGADEVGVRNGGGEDGEDVFEEDTRFREVGVLLEGAAEGLDQGVVLLLSSGVGHDVRDCGGVGGRGGRRVRGVVEERNDEGHDEFALRLVGVRG